MYPLFLHTRKKTNDFTKGCGKMTMTSEIALSEFTSDTDANCKELEPV
jgi:hypothetical protein